MTLNELEYAAGIIFELVRQHPELCPHDWEWMQTTAQQADGIEEHEWICRLCGSQTMTKTKIGERRRYPDD